MFAARKVALPMPRAMIVWAWSNVLVVKVTKVMASIVRILMAARHHHVLKALLVTMSPHQEQVLSVVAVRRVMWVQVLLVKSIIPMIVMIT